MPLERYNRRSPVRVMRRCYTLQPLISIILMISCVTALDLMRNSSHHHVFPHTSAQLPLLSDQCPALSPCSPPLIAHGPDGVRLSTARLPLRGNVSLHPVAVWGRFRNFPPKRGNAESTDSKRFRPPNSVFWASVDLRSTNSSAKPRLEVEELSSAPAANGSTTSTDVHDPLCR